MSILVPSLMQTAVEFCLVGKEHLKSEIWIPIFQRKK